jgi:hypothetical protein
MNQTSAKMIDGILETECGLKVVRGVLTKITMEKDEFKCSNNTDPTNMVPIEPGLRQQAVASSPFANNSFFNRRIPLILGMVALLCLSGPALTTAWGQNSAPVMNANLTILNMNAKVGEPFYDTIFASGTPYPTYSCTGLPAGLTVNASSGAISGTPTVSGTFNIGCTAANSVGTVTSNLTLNIYPAKPTTSTYIMRLIYTTNPPTGSPFGYLEYLPTQYNTTTNGTFPLLVFLHGANFMDLDGGSNSWNALWTLSTTGPGEVITSGNGSLFDQNNCIMVQPISWNPWEEPQTPAFFTWLYSHYRVNTNRVYVQGWSRGADGVLNYINANSSQIAACSACAIAVSPGSGIGPVTSVYTNVPLWVFEDWDDPYKGNNFQNWLDPIAEEYDNGGSVPDVMANYPGGSSPTAIYSATYTPASGWVWSAGPAIATTAPPLRVTMNPSGGHGGELWNADNATPSFWSWLFAQSKTGVVTNSPTTNSSPSSGQAPVLYWPLTATDSTGTNIPDASGNGNTGWMLNPGSKGSQIASTGGILGGACLTISSSATADDSGGVIFAANNPNSVSTLCTYPFSVALWCKGTTTLAMWSFSNGNEFHVLYGPQWANAVENSSTSSYQNEQFEGSAQADGNWHHWCITYNSPTSRSYYVDGESAGAYSGTAGIEDALYYFSVGCREYNTSVIDNVCAGYSLQDCAIWNTQLSPPTIAAIYALGHFGVAGAGTAAVTNFVNAYSNQTCVVINGTLWNYVTGLSTTIGTVTGSVAAGTAAVTLDAGGGGMQGAVAGVAPTLNASMSGNKASIQATGTPGSTYFLLTATNITGPWRSLGATTAAAGTGALLLTDPNATNRQQFYRTVP